MKKEIDRIEKALDDLRNSTMNRIGNIKSDLLALKQADEPKHEYKAGDLARVISYNTLFEKGQIIRVCCKRYGGAWGVETLNSMMGCDVAESDIEPATEAAQPAPTPPEPVQLWCAKDYKPYLTRGRIYTKTPNNLVKYDNGFVCSFNNGNFGDTGMTDKDFLFPLVHRPAKEGEWYVITNRNDRLAIRFKNGDVFQALHKSETGACLTNDGYFVCDTEYEVIEGYHGEYEPKPVSELLQGAHVCYESCNTKVMIPFKKYTFIDGCVKLENGIQSAQFESIDHWHTFNPKIKIARLIEN